MTSKTTNLMTDNHKNSIKRCNLATQFNAYVFSVQPTGLFRLANPKISRTFQSENETFYRRSQSSFHDFI